LEPKRTALAIGNARHCHRNNPVGRWFPSSWASAEAAAGER
jgi:hypothetical protein